MLAIRVDGGQSIGMGHVIRCLSLAQEIRKLGQNVLFISKFEEGIKKIKQSEFEVLRLINKKSSSFDGFDYGDKSELISETKEIIQFINKHGIKSLIVDSYNVDNEFFSSVRKKVKKLVYIDDLNAFDYDVDLIINYNANANLEDYSRINKSVKKLLGPEYVLVREQYRNINNQNIAKDVSEILITSGSTDYYSTIPFFLKAIVRETDFADTKLNVVIGQGFKNIDEIKVASRDRKNIILYEDVSDLSKLMISSDVAISSGGSTLYELCACGTPSLSYIIAQNQEKSAQALSKKGIIECLGWYHRLSTDVAVQKIKSLCIDFKRRKELSAKMQEVVDGNGARRAAEEILKQIN